MGVVHKHHPDWGSHIPILIKCLELTQGPVLELGMGASSTILLHALCWDQNRLLLSYDNDGRFIEQFKNFKYSTQSSGDADENDQASHVIIFVDDWDSAKETILNPFGSIKVPWSVVLVDHKPAIRRKEEIKLVTDADYVVVHDTQERADEFYGFEEIYPLFKYRYDYNKFANQTTVLSNKHELDIFRNTFN